VATSIIVVDDSAVDRLKAGKLLEQQLPCSVRYAANGKECLQLMAEQMPDLILADMQMPEMDGLELVARVKQEYPFVPVILMTAEGSEELAARALREGAASYVPKRYLAQDLVPTVRRILTGAHGESGGSGLMYYLETSDEVFVLPNDLTLIHGLVDDTQRKLRCLPLADEMERMRVGLALEEALTNAYYHGNLEVGTVVGSASRDAYEQRAARRLEEAPYRDRHIRVSLRITRQEAMFVVRDEGRGFDVAGLTAGMSRPDAEKAAGRGIVLMYAAMDTVHYNAAGNEVTLIKRGVSDTPSGEDTAVVKPKRAR
jgi:CheY-like chemotaxis protein/anti-sigma regulatory factor (Ser/Thr protein kinase)